MRKLLLATLAAVLCASCAVPVAQAADMATGPIYTKAPPVLPYSWTGIYVGANVGAGWSSTSQDLTSITTPGGATRDLNLSLASFSSGGFMGGGQFGGNYQVGPMVFGGEVEGEWVSLTGHGPCLTVGTCNASTRWIADVAGRFGLARDRLLIYAKGGVAWSGVDYATNVTMGGISLSGSTSMTRVGGLLGIGAQYAVTDNWLVRLEYDHISFQNANDTFGLVVANRNQAIPLTATGSFGQTIDLVKFGVDYKF